MKTFPLLPRFTRPLWVSAALLGLAGCATGGPAEATAPAAPAAASAPADSLPPYQARFGRRQPVIAIVGENSGTELTDFVIPYGVLAASGAAEVVTVATQPGVLRMRPALTLQTQETIAQFDVRFPAGADYVIVPAVVKYQDPTLLAWVKAQGVKGSTLVSICDGAVVVAGTGLMEGRRATAHWASEGFRRRKFAGVHWIADVRYVADGPIVSTAGISAALPASLALVEAIAGRDRARALATELGVSEWSAAHDTAPFRPRFGVNLRALIAANYTNAWFHSTETISVPLTPGLDEIALAVTADAYTRTGRSRVLALAPTTEPVRTRHGLIVIPDTLGGGRHPMDRMLPALDATPSGLWLAKSIDGIRQLYGTNTAYGVALDFEFPMIPDRPQPTVRKISAQ
ncbi:MAG: DJ-1/PfpI family protein [Verrucomicrobia bacterium]|nr:DJ-1/PfpI family protein [Verrucomicrobiota bacterium]